MCGTKKKSFSKQTKTIQQILPELQFFEDFTGTDSLLQNVGEPLAIEQRQHMH